MSKTKIEWCKRPGTLPEVWNVVTGCNKVSPGCKNCYAEIMHRRLQHMYPEKYDHDFLTGAHMHQDLIELPMKWKKPRTIFVNSMSDLFHDKVPFYFMEDVFMTMDICKWHTFLILTKRPKRLLEFIEYWKVKYGDRWKQVFPNVWIGVSVEDQDTANERIPLLLQVPAAVRFLSCEPLLGPVNLAEIWPGGTHFFNCLKEPVLHTGWIPNPQGLINWVIAGGESGRKARPMHPDWIRGLRDQCTAAGVPFFFKQWGEWLPTTMPLVSSQIHVLPNKYASHSSKFYQSDKDFCEYYMAGKNKSGRFLDGIEHNEFPSNILINQ